MGGIKNGWIRSYSKSRDWTRNNGNPAFFRKAESERHEHKCSTEIKTRAGRADTQPKEV
jgi:hypothetical protein